MRSLLQRDFFLNSIQRRWATSTKMENSSKILANSHLFTVYFYFPFHWIGKRVRQNELTVDLPGGRRLLLWRFQTSQFHLQERPHVRVLNLLQNYFPHNITATLQLLLHFFGVFYPNAIGTARHAAICRSFWNALKQKNKQRKSSGFRFVSPNQFPSDKILGWKQTCIFSESNLLASFPLWLSLLLESFCKYRVGYNRICLIRQHHAFIDNIFFFLKQDKRTRIMKSWPAIRHRMCGVVAVLLIFFVWLWRVVDVKFFFTPKTWTIVLAFNAQREWIGWRILMTYWWLKGLIIRDHRVADVRKNRSRHIGKASSSFNDESMPTKYSFKTNPGRRKTNKMYISTMHIDIGERIGYPTHPLSFFSACECVCVCVLWTTNLSRLKAHEIENPSDRMSKQKIRAKFKSLYHMPLTY